MGKNILIICGLLLCASCTPAQMAPILTTVDAVGRGVAHVLGWCESHDIDREKVVEAKKAVEEKDYKQAVALAATLVTKARQAGEPIPEEIEVLTRLVEGAMAAQSIEIGMRAASGGAK